MRRGGGRRASGACGGASGTRARRRGRRARRARPPARAGGRRARSRRSSIAASTSARAAPIAANAPPVRRTRSSPGSVREKRPDAHHVAEPRRRDRVDERADPVARAGVEEAGAAADRRERRAPRERRARERADEAERGEPEPDRLRRLELVERGRHIRPEQPGERDDDDRARGERSGQDDRPSADERKQIAGRCVHVLIPTARPVRLLAPPHFPSSAFRLPGMRGAIAAGHPLTAEVGAQVLAEGGNAVDACIAAGFASWVAESPLTGAGGGGFMLIHRERDRSTRVLDFFTAMPGRGLAVPTGSRDGRGGHRLLGRLAPGVQDRPGLGGRPRDDARARDRAPRLRDAALGRARRARRRAGAPRLRADPAAGLPARDPRPDPPSLVRGAPDLRQRRASGSSRATRCACPTSRARST